jgi:autotransporter-associated beta strand protein
LEFNDTSSAESATITNNGLLTFRANSTAGNAVITNNNQFLFNNDSTAGNATITNTNQLTFFSNATAGNATIMNSGNVLFDGDSTAGNAQLINTAPGAVINFFTPGPASDGRLTAGSIAGDGRFDLNDAELTVGGNNLSTNVTGVLTGTGIMTGNSLIKIGTGTLTLSGANTYTGATEVNGGTLAVNGSIAASSGVTVNSGGTLGGNGIVGNTTINGGTLAPGNSIGLLTVQGNLVFTAASSYMVEVSPSNADRVNVTGTANLGGATVNASFAAGSYVAKQYTIVNATSGLGGSTFGTFVNTNLPSGFKTSLSYDANNAYLDLALAFIAPPNTGLSGNQSGVGSALVNYFNRNGGIPVVYGGLTATGLTQASGETATGGQQTTFNAMTQFMGSMTDTFAAGRGGAAPGAMGFADEGNASAYASTAKSRAARDAYAMFTKAPLAQGYDPRWSVWASGFGGSQTTDGNAAAGSNTSSSRIGGVAVGADYLISPNTVAGFAMAGGGTSFSVTGGGSGRSDLFQIGGFVRHSIGSTYLSGALAYGWQDVTTNRSVMTDQLQARFSPNTFSGRFEVGNRTVTSWQGGLGLTPYAAVQFTAVMLPAYAETAVAGSNAFALSYTSKTVNDTRSELGLRTDKSYAVGDALLTLRGRAAWAHDFNTDRAASATFMSLPGASFVVNGAAAAHDAALTTASAEMSFISGISLAATFEGEFSDVTRSYAGKGVARYTW